MQVNGLYFTKSILDEIDEIVREEPSISRRQLSRRLCEAHNWRSPSGRLKDMACRKALAELDRRGVISLPSVSRTFSFNKVVEPVHIEVAPLHCTLEELGAVVVQPVDSRCSPDYQVWRSLMHSYHYLGSGPMCGAQIRYLISSPNYGPLGAMAFSSASYALRARDKYIGWSTAARMANLPRVVCNSRFLLCVQVPNLASHALSLALDRLPDDWHERYGVRPVLVETFVDPRRFSGTCYKAANWVEVGTTAGRRDGVAKRIFLRPLCEDWKEVLCQEPPIVLGAAPRPEDPANWAEEEFGSVRFPDDRLKRRLFKLAQDFYENSEANIPEACGSRAATIAAYRFFKNKAVSMDVLLTPHIEATIERIKAYPVVLAPQDTTTLDYNTHPMTEGLGPTGSRNSGGLGLILHDTLAFTVDGTPLGVLDAQCWARDPDAVGGSDTMVEETKGPSKRFDWYIAYKRTIEDKESAKWLRSFRKVAEIQRLCPETTLVSIGDQESDIWELLLEATKDPNGPKLLIRADRHRRRKFEDETLWRYMASLDVAARLKIHIPRSGSSRSRDAWVDLRFAKVELSPPERFAGDPPISLWAVYLLEDPSGAEIEEPIEWMLLTTAAVETVEDAKTRVEWYSGRWGIEVYHRTLKSGCRIRNRQLGTAKKLQACLGIDMVVAWRIYHMAMLGRETPNAPCTLYFDDVEWKTLCCLITKKPVPPEQPPTMAEAVSMVGKLGGHLGRKGDGPPGTQTLWRGLQHLESAVELARILNLFNTPP